MKLRTKIQIAVAAGVATGITAAVLQYSYYIGEKILFREHKERDVPSTIESKFGGKSVYINSEAGGKLRGILIEKEGNQGTVLMLHAMMSEAKDLADYVPVISSMLPEYNILLVDAYGHGQSDGDIRLKGYQLVEDLRAWNSYVLERYGNKHKVVIYGKEMGGDTALLASSRHILSNVKCMIVDSAYTSVYEVLGKRLYKQYYLPKFILMPLLRRQILREASYDIKENVVSAVAHNDIPTIYVHEKGDLSVPLSHVFPLFNGNRGEKELFILKDEQLYQIDNQNEYEKIVYDFVDKYTK